MFCFTETEITQDSKRKKILKIKTLLEESTKTQVMLQSYSKSSIMTLQQNRTELRTLIEIHTLLATSFLDQEDNNTQ